MAKKIINIIKIVLIIFFLIEFFTLSSIKVSFIKQLFCQFNLLNELCSIKDILKLSLNILYIFGSLFTIFGIWLAIYTYKSKRYNANIFTKQEKELIKLINKRKIRDFETLIIKYLKPDIAKFGKSLIWDGIEFKPDDNVYIFYDPRETILKIRSAVKVIKFLIHNNAINIISKYEKIIEDKHKTLNPFYVFTKTPKNKYYNEYPVLKNILREHFDIDDYDKEIRPIENRLQQYIK